MALAAGAAGIGTGAATADTLPTADISIVSQTANVRHAQIGDEVTFTVVAVNDGPDAVDLNVVEDPALLYPGGGGFPASDFQLVREECDRGISPDTPACEYGTVQPGETVTTAITAVVKPTASKEAANTVCVFSQNGAITDPNPENDCLTTSVRIVGRRGG
jgi:hypothetical protein